jgi:hypothetical protein
LKIPLPKLGLSKPVMMKPPPMGTRRPPLPAMRIPDRNPLEEIDPTGDLQADVNAELGAVEQGFRERMKAEEERRDAATGSGEYFIVCFANGEQCGAFLQGLAQHVSSIKLGTDDLVIDGRDLAKYLKIEIPDGKAVGKVKKIDRDWSKRSK